MLGLLQRFLNCLGLSAKGRPPSQRPRVRLGVESLGERIMPAVSLVNPSVAAAATAGQLTMTGAAAATSSPFLVLGDHLNVSGTAGADTFTYTAGQTQSQVTVNGASYTFSPAAIHSISCSGFGGSDTAILYDQTYNPGFPTFLSLSPGGGTLTTTSLYGQSTLTLSQTPNIYAYSVPTAASDTSHSSANLFGAAAGNTFVGSTTITRMFGPGYYFLASGFATVDAYGRGGSDSAQLTGGFPDDQFQVESPSKGWPLDATLTKFEFRRFRRGP
jgi:hypothetical protein